MIKITKIISVTMSLIIIASLLNVYPTQAATKTYLFYSDFPVNAFGDGKAFNAYVNLEQGTNITSLQGWTASYVYTIGSYKWKYTYNNQTYTGRLNKINRPDVASVYPGYNSYTGYTLDTKNAPNLSNIPAGTNIALKIYANGSIPGGSSSSGDVLVGTYNISIKPKAGSIAVKDERGNVVKNGEERKFDTAYGGYFLLSISTSNGSFTASSNAGNWLTVEKVQGNSSAVRVQWTENRTGASRKGTITITSGGNNAAKLSLYVTQSKYFATVNFPNSGNYKMEGIIGNEIVIPDQVYRNTKLNKNQIIIGWSKTKGAKKPDNGNAYRYTLPQSGSSISLYPVFGNSLTDMIYQELAGTSSSWVKGTAPELGLACLFDVLSGTYSSSLSNQNKTYNQGSQKYLPSGYLSDQSESSNSALNTLKFGDKTVGSNGCGPIAIYNALRFAGKNKDMASIIYDLETHGSLLAVPKAVDILKPAGTILKNQLGIDIFKSELKKRGSLGTNPNHIVATLKRNGLSNVQEYYDSKKFLDAVYDAVGKKNKGFILCTLNHKGGEYFAHYRFLTTSSSNSKIHVYNETLVTVGSQEIVWNATSYWINNSYFKYNGKQYNSYTRFHSDGDITYKQLMEIMGMNEYSNGGTFIRGYQLP